MSMFRVSLFREFCVEGREQAMTGLESRKVQELLSYLLVNRDRPHTREKLTTLLWPNSAAAQAKQYLRQTLWQLHSALERHYSPSHTPTCTPDCGLLSVAVDWIQINLLADVWVDVAEFEKAYALVRSIEGRCLDASKVTVLQAAVHLYRGDLLENWYQDWCIFERERLQNIYLVMLDKLVGYCEAVQDYETGVGYATQLLKSDKAHERTYRRLMRLHYFAGDRTAALRQFQLCEKVLQEELGVQPSQRTLQLQQQIQCEQVENIAVPPARPDAAAALPAIALPNMRERLTNLYLTLIQAQQQLEQEIEAVKTALAQLR